MTAGPPVPCQAISSYSQTLDHILHVCQSLNMTVILGHFSHHVLIVFITPFHHQVHSKDNHMEMENCKKKQAKKNKHFFAFFYFFIINSIISLQKE